MNKAFEINKVRRLIKTSGKLFCFKRYKKNEFGESDDENLDISITLAGVYHEASGYITVTENEGTRYQKKVTPMILTLWESIEKTPVFMDDRVLFNGVNYKVCGVTNIQEENAVADISLEVVL